MTDHADVGYLSWDEFERFREAVHQFPRVVPWFRVAGHIKGQQEEVRAASSNYPLGLHPTWIAAEELTRLSTELQYWENLEDIAADHYGKTVAMQFTREMETALHKWPIEDKPHKVRHLRCQSCAGETIKYTPPKGMWEPVRIACTECEHAITEDEFKMLAALVAAEIKRTEKAIAGTRRLGAA